MTYRSKPTSCEGCACHSQGTDFSQVEGTGSIGVMLVGEASGELEARDQLPFRPYAPAGSVLERIIRRMGLDRQQFAITNILRCRPRNNWLENSPWEYPAISHCRPNLDAAISRYHPRAIVALGNTAIRELTGLTGKSLGVGHLAGYVLRGPNDIPVVGNFHPAFLRRGKASYQGLFARILKRAINIAADKDRNWDWDISPAKWSRCECIGFDNDDADPTCPLCSGSGYIEEGEPNYGPLHYQTRPTIDQAREYLRRILERPGAVVAYDLETSESTSLDEDARTGFADTHIELIQFSEEPGSGIAFPWDGEFKQIAGEILRTPNTKVGWNNWLFDNKVLRACGAREGLDLIPRGIVHDGLCMFHHWQPDLPAHLQAAASFIQFPFPWKHLAGTDVRFYGCCDVDATLRLYRLLEATLKRDRVWDDEGYEAAA